MCLPHRWGSQVRHSEKRLGDSSMTNHEHHSEGGKHDQHGHGHEHGHGHPGGRRRPIHHDWRLWAAVVLMLGAMALYVLSDNEAFAPGGTGETMPAAPAAP